MRQPTELINVVTAKTLNIGGPTQVKVEFPMDGWYRAIHIRVNTTLTVGTGTTPIADGELSIINGLSLYDNRRQYAFNIPGRGLYRLNAVDEGVLGQRTAIAASNGTYDASLSFNFVGGMHALRPDDSAVFFDSKSGLTLDLSMGTVADLLGTVGTASIVATVDIMVERWVDADWRIGVPTIYRELRVMSADPSTQTYIDMEKADDQGFNNILMFAGNSATSGKHFSGTASDTTISDITLETTQKNYYVKIPWTMLRNINKKWYQLETALAGFANLDLTRGGSIRSALSGGNKSVFRVSWTNGTLSTSRVSALSDTWRVLK